MGMTASALSVMSNFPAKRVLSLGYPDIIATPEMIQNIFNVTPTVFVDNGGWHGVSHELPETVAFFGLLGSELTCVDVHASRGVEMVMDLNYPQDIGKFDLVLDCGTTEHCFNIGQAIINAANAVAEGGVIFHTPPLSMINHGFYNLNPTLFHDFYTQNDWKIEFMAGVQGGSLFAVEATTRYAVPSELSLYVVARRTNMRPLSFPTQSKYLANPDLKVIH